MSLPCQVCQAPTFPRYCCEENQPKPVLCDEHYPLHLQEVHDGLDPNGPQTKAELWRYICENIENEGFHYALVDYTSLEGTNCDQLDPELAKLWREYEALVKKISTHVGVRTA